MGVRASLRGTRERQTQSLGERDCKRDRERQRCAGALVVPAGAVQVLDIKPDRAKLLVAAAHRPSNSVREHLPAEYARWLPVGNILRAADDELSLRKVRRSSHALRSSAHRTLEALD